MPEQQWQGSWGQETGVEGSSMGSCWVPLAAQLLQLWASLYLVAVVGTEAAVRHRRYVASVQ